MKVKVSASSANFGPGFDCFGAAWDLRNTIEFVPGGSGLEIYGCDARFRNEKNLAYAAYKAALDAAGVGHEPLIINFADSPIPVSRGLGSSAALIVAGVTAANEIRQLGFDRRKLLEIATIVEGHPDNIAPALLGGFTVSAMDGDKVLSVQCSVSEKLRFTVLIPDFELSTSLSRGVMPKEYKKADAVFNISRASLLLKGLETGSRELISAGLQDMIHQPYRKRLIDGYEKAEKLALDLGAIGVCISGAGSTMLCISDDPSFSGKMAETMSRPFPRWKVTEVFLDRAGAIIEV